MLSINEFIYCVSDYFPFKLVLVPQDAKLEYPAFDETWYMFRNNGKCSLRKPDHAIYRDFQIVKIKVSVDCFVIFLIFAQNKDCGYTARRF